MVGQRTRAMRATAGIVLAILAIAVSGAVFEWAIGANTASKALCLSDAGEESRWFDAFSRSDATDAQLAGDSSGVSLAGEATGLEAVPPWFAQELFSLDGMRDIRVSGAGDVIGFVASLDGEDLLARFRTVLQRGGWMESGTGIDGCSVFAKEEGICRWAMVSCVPVGSATSVVVRCVVNRT